MFFISIIHFLACMILLGEALMRVAHSRATASGLYWTERWPQILDAAGWSAVALGAIASSPIVSFAGPPVCLGGLFLHLETPTLAEMMVLAGGAVIVLRHRVSKRVRGQPGSKP